MAIPPQHRRYGKKRVKKVVTPIVVDSSAFVRKTKARKKA